MRTSTRLEIDRLDKKLDHVLSLFDKYSPDQPRVPKGSPGGGRWTSGGGGGESRQAKDKRLGRESSSMRRIDSQLSDIRSRRRLEATRAKKQIDPRMAAFKRGLDRLKNARAGTR